MEETIWLEDELFVIIVLKWCLLDHGNNVSWAEINKKKQNMLHKYSSELIDALKAMLV